MIIIRFDTLYLAIMLVPGNLVTSYRLSKKIIRFRVVIFFLPKQYFPIGTDQFLNQIPTLIFGWEIVERWGWLRKFEAQRWINVDSTLRSWSVPTGNWMQNNQRIKGKIKNTVVFVKSIPIRLVMIFEMMDYLLFLILSDDWRNIS